MATLNSKYVANVYNKIASEFKNSRHYSWNWVTEFINKYVDVANSSDKVVKVLDIGCGGGRNIKTYQTNKIEITGLDNSSEFIKLCKNDDLEVVLSDMTSMPFPDNHFDNLMVIASFHHLTNLEDRNKALQEICRILKRNGTMMLSVWSKIQPEKTKRKFSAWGDTLVPWKNLKGEVFERYYYIFRLDEIKQLFLDNGLNIISHTWECGNEVFILENHK
jgi:ubiquinone/menaquinone biosynthesis C-methylase UbiE